MRILIFILFSISFSANACTCTQAFNSQERFEREFIRADMVSLVKAGDSRSGDEHGTYTAVKVLKSWKGLTGEVTVFTESDLCSPYLETGKNYFIFASKNDKAPYFFTQIPCGYSNRKSFFDRESRFISKQLQKYPARDD